MILRKSAALVKEIRPSPRRQWPYRAPESPCLLERIDGSLLV
jgi:hypothetical protein